MYQFVDPNSYQMNRGFVPSDNLKINGRYINDVVSGYQQLSVGGRSLISRKADTVDVPGRRGVWLNEIKDEPREIDINYQLSATNSAQLRERFSKLNQLLRETSILTLEFRDETDFEYTGVLTSAGNFSEDQLSIVDTFTLLIPDPYKKRRIQFSTGLVTLSDATQVLPEKIIIRTTKLTDRVEVVNGTKRIALSESFDANQLITFEFRADDISITYKNRSILYAVMLHAPLEEFYLKHQDRVTAVNAVVERIEWRDERL